MRVCYFGAYDRSYPRNVVLITGLRKAGVEVVECHSAAAVKPVRYAVLAANFVRAARDVDVIVVGASGHAYVPLARALATASRTPLIVDAFVSQYDTVILDRREAPPDSWRAKYCLALDRMATSLADLVLMDTPQHAEYYAGMMSRPVDKFRWLLVGADGALFRPLPAPHHRNVFTVTFFGTFIPLQGVNYILRAAKLLAGRSEIVFKFIGRGQAYPEARRLAADLGLSNVAFVDPVPPEALPYELQDADVSLGIFGDTAKAQRVIPNKVFAAMAMGKPIVTGDTPAARELLRDGHNALLVPVAQPEAIVAAVQRMTEDAALRTTLGENALATFRQTSTPEVIGRQFRRICQDLLGARTSEVLGGCR